MLDFLKGIFGGAAVADGVNLDGQSFKNEFQNTPRAVLLDVRTAGEFAGGTLPSAKNIDFMSPSFAQKIEKLDKNATYFVFCRSGNRSGSACRIMKEKGFEVRNLVGGIGAFPR